jgi:ribosomal protein S27E
MQTLPVRDSGNEGGQGGEVFSCAYGNEGTIVSAEESPLPVIATPSFKPKSGVITRFLGKQKVERTYIYTCPACGHSGEIASLPSESIHCSSCNRLLRVSAEVPQSPAL